MVIPPGLPGLEAEDGVAVTTRSARGVVGLMRHVWTGAHRPPAPWVAVSGTQGRIYCEVGASWLRLDDGRARRVWQGADDGHGLVPMVREARAPELSGAVGLEALAVVLRVYESMAQGAR